MIGRRIGRIRKREEKEEEEEDNKKGAKEEEKENKKGGTLTTKALTFTFIGIITVVSIFPYRFPLTTVVVTSAWREKKNRGILITF